MKRKIIAPQQNPVIVHYDESLIFPTIKVDLGNSESYRAAIEEIKFSLSEDRTLGKLLALEVYSSQGSESVVTFFMHKKDSYIVGFIDNENVRQFPSDAELAYNAQTKFLLNDIRPNCETVRMLGFVIAEATRFFPIAEYIELIIEENRYSFDINAPLHNRENKFWYIEEPRGSNNTNTMTELTIKKLKTSWAANNKYYLKEQVINDFTTSGEVVKTISNTFLSVLKEVPSSLKLINDIRQNLEIDHFDLSTIQESLSSILSGSNQQVSNAELSEVVNSHSEKISECQNQLQYLEDMRIKAVTDYEDCKLKIENKQKQNKPVSTKLVESQEFHKKMVDSISSTMILIETQLNMHQKLFDLTKVAIHTNLAVPYPFHPLPEERKAVVSLNISSEVTATEETQGKKKGLEKHHKVSKHSSDDDPDNDKGGEAISDHTSSETIKYKAYSSLLDYYFGWIYQLPKWLQDSFLNSKVIKEFIDHLIYDSRFIEKTKILENNFYVKSDHNQDHEHENNIDQKAQINYDNYIISLEDIAMDASIAMGIITFQNFIEPKIPLLGMDAIHI